jgi:hypothetical protein
MATPPMVPAGWYADPPGRHEYRYWDGTYRAAGVVVVSPCTASGNYHFPAARQTIALAGSP